MTSREAIPNAPLPLESNGTFSNYQLGGLVLLVGWFTRRTLLWFLPYQLGFVLSVLLTGLPVTLVYWNTMSKLGPPVRDRGILPGKNIEDYMTITDPALKAKYHGRNKIPVQVFHDAYFDKKIELKGEASCASYSNVHAANPCSVL